MTLKPGAIIVAAALIFGPQLGRLDNRETITSFSAICTSTIWQLGFYIAAPIYEGFLFSIARFSSSKI